MNHRYRTVGEKCDTLRCKACKVEVTLLQRDVKTGAPVPRNGCPGNRASQKQTLLEIEQGVN